MRGSFAPRFALEAGFLILLGVGAGYADLRPAVIVALLAGGWVLVTLIELAVWRSQARPVAGHAPADAPLDEQAGIEPEPEPVAAEEPIESFGDTEYPLRAGAGEAPSEEVEEYTRVIAASPEDDQPGEAAE